MSIRSYTVLVEGEAWVNVDAHDEEEAKEKATEVLESDPFAWDSLSTTIINEDGVEE